MADLASEHRKSQIKSSLNRILNKRNKALANKKEEIVEDIPPKDEKYYTVAQYEVEKLPKVLKNSEELARNAAKKAEIGELWEDQNLFQLDSLIERLQPIEDLKLNGVARFTRFDLRMVASMAYVMATPQEIAAFSFCTVAEIRRELSNPDSPLSLVYNAASSFSKKRLRHAQFQSAIEDRNPAMLKFLGENYLDQNEVQKMVLPVVEQSEDIEKRRQRLSVIDNILKEINDD